LWLERLWKIKQKKKKKKKKKEAVETIRKREKGTKRR